MGTDDATVVERLAEERALASRFLRATALDSAHAATTPLASIKASLHAIRRSVPAADRRAHRALEIVDLATDDLTRLTRSSRARLETIADILEQVRQPTDVLETLREHIDTLRDTAVVEFTAPPPGSAIVSVPPRLLDTLVEAVLELALEISASQRGYSVALTSLGSTVQLRIEGLDEPGITGTQCADDLDRDWRVLHIRYLVEVLGGRLALTASPMNPRYVIVITLPKT